MLVGVLTKESLAYYYSLTRLAPIQFIVPPMVWLSRPEENVSREAVAHINDEGSTVQVNLKPTLFRHLYNPDSGVPGYYAAMLPDQSPISEVRRRLGVLEYEDAFIPSMLLCHDGMRTRSVKQFCQGIANTLADKLMSFEVFIADQNNPDHRTLFENYNTETQEVFGHAVSYQ